MRPADRDQPSRRDVPPQAPPFQTWRGPWLAILLALLCYFNSLANGFTYDDKALVRQNLRIRSLSNWRAVWLTDWWNNPTRNQPHPADVRDLLYRPLTMFTFALDYAVGRLNPFGYHATNVVLHALATGLLWLFVWRLFGDASAALLAAVLFALHPVHSEAVANIVGRAEVLATLLLLLGLCALLAHRDGPRMRDVLIAAPLFLLALLAKETAVCYPVAALLVLHFARPAALRLRPRMAGGAALLLLPLAIYFPLRYWVLHGRLMPDLPASVLYNPYVAAGPLERLLGVFTILGHYARLLFVPRTLSCDYGLAITGPDSDPNAMTALGTIAALGLLAALLGYRSRRPALRTVAFLAALFLAGYALISNAPFTIGVSLAERFMYWPSVPVCAGAALGVVGLWRRYARPPHPPAGRRRLMAALGMTLLFALGLRTVVRNADWRNDLTLFSEDARNHPRGAHLACSLATTYLQVAADLPAGPQREHYLRHAADLLDRALVIYPRFPRALRERGVAYMLAGRTDKAIRFLERAAQLTPSDPLAQRHLTRLLGQREQARTELADLLAAVNREPDNPSLWKRLDSVYVKLGRYDDALRAAARAVELAPDDPQALRAYSDALLLNDQDEEAEQVLRRLLQKDPDDWAAHTNLARLLEHRDPRAALEHARRAYELNPDDLRTQNNLAEAYARNGRIDEALRLLRALRDSLLADDPLRTALDERIAELEQRQTTP